MSLSLLAITVLPALTAEASCLDVADATARVDCYHAEVEAMKVASPAAASNTGKWLVYKDKSKLDDSETAFAILSANEAIGPQYVTPSAPVLTIRCEQNTTIASIHFSGFFMGDFAGMGRVDYRVDDRKAHHRNFGASTSNEHLGLWSGAQSIPFVKDLLGGKSLYVEAVPVNENPVHMTFPIDGIDEAIKPIGKACGW